MAAATAARAFNGNIPVLSPSTTPRPQKQSPPKSYANTAVLTAYADPNSLFLKLCSDGDLAEAMNSFDGLHKPALDEEAYVALLRLCEWRKSHHDGMRVYRFIARRSRSQFSIRIGNATLAMLVKFGEIEDAWQVFGRMPERDLFTWNVMVGGYAKEGFLDEAVCLYGRMLWAGVQPDIYTLPCVLRTCAGIPEKETGRVVHAHMFRYGLETEVDVLNAVLTMYAKCGDLENARKVFDGMSTKDCISWNAMISGYFESDQCNEGLALFTSMCWKCVEPDLMTITSVVAACVTVTHTFFGKGIHGYAVKRGFVTDVSTNNSLIAMYSGFGSMAEAENIFVRMTRKDVMSWTAIISGYGKNGFPNKALEFYLLMEAEGVNPDEVTIASILSVCTCLGRLDIGIKLHEAARRKGLVPCSILENGLLHMYSKFQCIDRAVEIFRCMQEKDVVSWSTIIAGFCMNQRSFEALSVFQQMLVDVKPNHVTSIAALSACGNIGALMWGKEIHAQALRTGIISTNYVKNAVLDFYVKCGRMEFARGQFNTMSQNDVVSWNIMLAGHAARGHGDLAVAQFNRMVEVGVLPDEVTFVALLCACARSGMVSKGWEFFHLMNNEYSVEPNLKHHACIVDLLSRYGSLNEALEFINRMPVQPDAAIWGALLNGCRIHRNVELGEVAARHIFEIEPLKVGYHVLLCNLYADAEKWDKLARARKVMRENGIEVDPGCSWIEVRGHVHAFLSDDTSHPQMKEIDGVLRVLYKRMEKENLLGRINLSSGQAEEASKDDIFCGHSERLAVAFGLISSSPGTPIRVTKNLYTCRRCHAMVKLVSKMMRRNIMIRDTEQFHHFRDGSCSCGDRGYVI